MNSSDPETARDEGDDAPAVEFDFPPAEFELVLRKPVEHAGETYDRLHLREPTDEEWEKIMSKPDREHRRFGLALISGVPEKAIAKIGIGDTVRGEAYLASFFDIGRVRGLG